MDATSLSEEFANSVLPVTIFFGILATFGFLGNIFVLYVYRYKYPPCNFRNFVCCLAITDFVSCLFVFPSEIVGHRMWFSYPRSAVWFCKLKTFIVGIAVMTTSLLLLLIAVDRFKKVCRPLGPQISHQIAFRLCVASLALAVFMTTPIPILFGIQHENITHGGENIEITSCEKDEAYKDTNWMAIYLIIMYYLPIVLFMATTTLLYCIILRKMFSRKFLNYPYRTLAQKKNSYSNEEAYSERRATVNSVIYDRRSTVNSVVCDLKRNGDIKALDKNKPKTDESALEPNNDISDLAHIENSAVHTRNTESKQTDQRQAITNHATEKNLTINANIKQTDKTHSNQKLTVPETLINGGKGKLLATCISEDATKQKLTDYVKVSEPVKTRNNHRHSGDDNLIHSERGTGERSDKFVPVTKKTKTTTCASAKPRVMRKTTIMFVVTLIFNLTMLIYFCALFVIIRKKHIFEVVDTNSAAILFFCWRIYFINHVINPVVYGVLDYRFREVFQKRSSIRA